MALNTGVFNTSLNPAELNTRSFAGTILRLFPRGSAPLFALSSQSGTSRAKASTHGYFTKTLTFVNQVLAAGQLAADTTIEVPSTTGIIPDMVLWNPRTKENIRVLTVSSATVFTATRAFGRVAAADMNIGDNLIAIGMASAEGSNRPSARSLTTVYIPNYTSIVRNAWAITDTARASLTEAGYGNIAENRRDCTLFHSQDIEGALLFSQPKMDTTGAQPLHSTQGIIDAITQYAPANVNTAGATTNYDQLVALVDNCFNYSTDQSNPDVRTLVGGNTAMKVINDVGRKSGQVQITMKETSFGMQFTSFKFYRGTLNLLNHPLLNGLGLGNMAIIVDIPALKLAYMDGRNAKREEYPTGATAGDSGVDAQGGSLTSEFAVELINPSACGVIYGLTAGVA